MKNDMLEINKKCWDNIAQQFFGITALPEYGPFIKSETELNLFGDVSDKKVLEIGCGSGHSLEYMAKRGAQELWGMDISSTQIETAKDYLSKKDYNANLYCSPMELEADIPKNYFDIIYSIYALGWTTDLKQTFKNIFSYLKEDGILIFSWDHPIYQCLGNNDTNIVVERSYFDDGIQPNKTFKGQPVTLNRIRLSTFINELISSGLNIEKLIEGDIAEKYTNIEAEPSEQYYSLYRAKYIPNSFIIKSKKIKTK
ncbi:bifunctional 2-polyprenyl-6-hydroxyphenol methylase/3-demethylubiquinol 3-O-methyltransferase UbiG [Clostridium sp.]|uniref:class I SAM-dependent methyltransferase n=1 Tax=Clostridium sp. TaxID=1506 RepID=UPI00260AE24B|nr:class I SAM-dependent methyltransferase [Clostridium sp.]